MDVITLATGSTGNCYFVKDVNGKTIILDCGINFQEITHHQDFPKFSDIEFVFVSHIH
jgi:Cft2 family RNA processing exonuclease